MSSSEDEDEFDFDALLDAEKKEDQDVTQSETLAEAFAVFGCSTSDVLTQREMILVYSRITHAMRDAVDRLVADACYSEADRVVRRIAKLKTEFRQLQMHDERRRQASEVHSYDEAAHAISANLAGEIRCLNAEVAADCDGKLDELVKLHAWQRRQLEKQILRMHKPPVRFTKRLLEWKSSEKHLARLRQFEEAKALNKRIAVLEPAELEQHEKDWAKKFDQLRAKLAKRQGFQRRKLDEKLHDVRLVSRRDGEAGVRLSKQRLKNHRTDMRHAHVVDRTHLPQYCKVVAGRVRPVVQKRARHTTTSSTFRGTQLLQSLQAGVQDPRDAKRSTLGGTHPHGSTSLCALHDFDAELSGTVRLQ